jgi:hypothetical protein
MSIWVRKAERHDVAWLIAIAPNPSLATALALSPRAVLHLESVATPALLACLWIGLMLFCARRMNDAPMEAPDLDFSVANATIVSSAALLVLVVEALAE